MQMFWSAGKLCIVIPLSGRLWPARLSGGRGAAVSHSDHIRQCGHIWL